ncbi:MAG: PAS domain S-box protein [Acidobacteria bacterium]|nr:PAS domain S-box protein [Acidobacteriota bacterium]MBI3663879.1 PAS domain S-box protein [Acidobacteriota bacterium]
MADAEAKALSPFWEALAGGKTRADLASFLRDARYRLLVDSGEKIFFYVHDRRGSFRYLSSSVQSVLGYDPGELLGQPYDLFLAGDPSDAAVRERKETALQSGNRAPAYTATARRKDSSRIVLELIESPLVQQGKVVGMQGFARDITEHKIREDLHLFFFCSLDLLCIAGFDGYFKRLNPAWEKTLGFTEQELLARPYLDFVHPDDRAATLAEAQKLTTGAETVAFENRYLCRDSSYKWLSWSVHPLPSQQLLYAVARDITGRKHADEELRKAHNELELRVQERTADLAFTNEILLAEISQRIQAEQKTSRLNRVYSVLSEINQTIVRAHDPKTLFAEACRIAVEHGDFRMAWIGLLDEADGAVQPSAWAGAQGSYLEKIRIRLDGGPESQGPTGTALREGRHFICNDIEHDPCMGPWRELALQHGYRSSAAFPLKVNGRVVGAFNLYAGEPEHFDDDEIRLLDELAADISFSLESIAQREHREQAEEALRASEARYRELFENSTLGIFRSSPEGAFLDVNPALVAMLGYASKEELLPLSIPNDVYADPADRERLFKRYAETGRFAGAEVQWKRKDGKLISVLLSARMVRDPGGQLTALECFVEDVTERRALQKQFQAAQKFEAIGHLASGIAHDFNNVLGAILGWAELSETLVPAESKLHKNLQVIIEQAQRASGLTRQLLAFARRQHMEPRVISLNASVEEVAGFLGKVIGRDIELRTALAPGVASVRADPTHIEQVLMNLCVNARDAMPRGGKLVIATRSAVVDEDYCRNHPYVQPGDYVQLSVADTGVGMDAATRERIFEPFFSTKEVGKGTGLGLATVYGMVKQHGGFIEVYSEVGQGATFHLYFPASAKAPEKEKKAEITPLRGGTETILIAEDNEDLAALAREALEGMGYTVLCARDGEEAVRLFEAHRDRIDLLLLDVVMPGLSGPAAYSEMCAMRTGVPTLFASGHSYEAPALGSLVERGAELLQKPYSTKALLFKVREVLDRRRR